MGSHVPEQRLLDVMEGTGADDRAHVEACPHCRTRLAEARAGMALAAGAKMPEPLPLYWEALRRQVRRRLDEETVPRPALWRRIPLVPAVAAAAVLAAIVTVRPSAVHQAVPAPEPRLPAWSALPPAEEDEGLDVLRAVAPAVVDASPPAGCAGMAECETDLSDEESRILTERLRQEIGHGRAI